MLFWAFSSVLQLWRKKERKITQMIPFSKIWREKQVGTNKQMGVVWDSNRQGRLPYSLRRSLIPSRTFCKPRILFRVPIPGKREVHPEFRKILEIEIREVKKCRKKKLQACLRPGLLHFYRPDCSLIVLFGVWVGLGLGSDFFPKIQDGAVKCGRKVSGGLEKVISSKKSGFWVLQGGFCWHFALRINRRSPY